MEHIVKKAAFGARTGQDRQINACTRSSLLPKSQTTSGPHSHQVVTECNQISDVQISNVISHQDRTFSYLEKGVTMNYRVLSYYFLC